MTVPVLSYAALVSRDVAATVELLQRHLGLRRTDVACEGSAAIPVFSVGEAALVICPPGHPLVEGEDRPGVHHIALAVADPQAAADVLARKGLPIRAGHPDKGLGGTARIAMDPGRTAGVRTYLSEGIALDRSASPLIERLDHLGIASADNPAAIDVFCNRVGMALESQQTDMEVQVAIESFTSDKYGVVHHTRPATPVGGLRVAFITAGDCELEFLQNFDPRQGGAVQHGAAGNTRQDQGAIARFVASRGPGLHHIAFKTADIDATLSALRRAGVRMIDTVGRPGSRRALIGFVHPGGAGGILFHFVQRP
jgi:catechol 2,3-dioxygenase-like lactoylglutathione lyase family enzyme